MEVDGSRASITLDQPQRRNPQSPAFWAALAAAGSALPARVRVVVVRAEGPSFSAGLDRRMFTSEGIPGQASLAALASVPPDELDATIAGYQRAFSWLRAPELISVAAVQGHAVGAGFQLALACDLRVLADDAQLAMRETVLGLVPDLGGTGVLVEAIGYARALQMCLSGRSMGADEAVACGLAVHAVPRPELDTATDALVEAILAAPAGAVAETKALLQGAGSRDPAGQLAAERAAQIRRLTALAGGAT